MMLGLHKYPMQTTFIIYNDSGEKDGSGDLRNQLLYNMAVDYKNYYKVVEIHLDWSYKQWLKGQLD